METLKHSFCCRESDSLGKCPEITENMTRRKTKHLKVSKRVMGDLKVTHRGVGTPEGFHKRPALPARPFGEGDV